MGASTRNLILLGSLFLGVGIAVRWLGHAPSSTREDDGRNSGQRSEPAPGAWLEAREQKIDQTAWAKERLAEECGRTFDRFWDALNASSNKLGLAATFPVSQIILGKREPPQSLPHDIQRYLPAEPGPTLSGEQWRAFVERVQRDGWKLETVEFWHVQFDTDASGQPGQSRFWFSANLVHPGRMERASLAGDLIVDWGPRQPGQAEVPVRQIDASRLTLLTRSGPPVFQPIFVESIQPPGKSPYIDPLLLYDLDGDGVSEIILAARNRVYRRRGDHYVAEPLCRYPPGLITSAVIADFDGDGVADLLCAQAEGLFLFKGSPQGTFDEPGRLVWSAHPPLKNAMVLTCGDVDHDGDLDVFLGQYRVPTLAQILRPHYYDANDGHPAYLLLNDGRGRFTDATEAAGLGPKRFRRCYSATFADLDHDGNLDLAVASDFAGLDLYRNDGHGRFTDVTSRWVADSHAFGMALALADFNADGLLDLLLIGMPSPTVDRLEHLGLWRADATEDRTMRARMTFGNRLYLARPEGGFEQTPMNDSIARSGWSWGCSAFDWDNDGYPDAYFATGLESKQSVRDYEPEFWLHDIYVDERVDDVSATAYFLDQYGRTRGAGWSYGGYQKNRLYWNQHGASFLEVGHLLGVALEQDSRNVVSDDLDGDGRVDLLVATLEVWPKVQQTLHVYQNRLPDPGHWIGFHFREQPGQSPIGAQVTLHYGGHTTVRQTVTGDSHRSQHANTVHFGLGAVDQVERVEVRWVNGRTLNLTHPAINRYHWVRAP